MTEELAKSSIKEVAMSPDLLHEAASHIRCYVVNSDELRSLLSGDIRAVSDDIPDDVKVVNILPMPGMIHYMVFVHSFHFPAISLWTKRLTPVASSPG